MNLWERIRNALAEKQPIKAYNFDQELASSLHTLADREQRPEEEIAADLISYAMTQHQIQSIYWQYWQLLSPREQQVAVLICHSYTNQQIADRLVVSMETVKTHVRNVLRKFKMHRKAELRQALANWDFSAWDDLEP
jgi:DNA-binding NarL/FixJ family response regulator